VAGALQLGKVPPALLPIAAEYGTGLPGAAALLSFFALIAALAGLSAGFVAARLGARRVVLVALGVMGAAGLAAAAAPTLPLLYAARVAEGVAFLAVTIAAPTLLAARVAERDRNTALSLWSTYMPAGIALGMFAAPLLDVAGWRAVWAGAALLPFAAGFAVLRLVPASAGRPVRTEGDLPGAVRALVRARLPLVVALGFPSYALVYFGIAGFLPAFLVERHGVALGLAGFVSAFAAVANVGGNLAAGQAMRRGVRPTRLVLGCGSAMALLAALSFALPAPWWVALALSVLASGIGGAVPASLFALVPRSVPDPALTAPAMGLVIQANNIGQLLGPLLIAAAAGVAWGAVALPLLAAGLVVAWAALALRRAEAAGCAAPGVDARARPGRDAVRDEREEA
jgi:predicted MFS family arabinose efflux permease